jgi:hypothetical protein
MRFVATISTIIWVVGVEIRRGSAIIATARAASFCPFAGFCGYRVPFVDSFFAWIRCSILAFTSFPKCPIIVARRITVYPVVRKLVF